MRFKLSALVLIVSLGIILSPFKAHATTYYVSSTGSDSNSGTSTANPWQTATKVSGFSFAPGDSVLFKTGDSFSGKITPAQSGTAGNPITYGSYGTSSKPVIDAGGQTRVFDIRNKSYLNFDNLELRYGSSENIFLFTADSNLNFSNLILRGGTSSIAISTGSFSNITFTNIQSYDYTTYGIGATASTTGITIDTFTAIASSTTATTTATGIYFGGGSTHTNFTIKNSNLSNQRYGIDRSPTNTIMNNFTVSTTTISNNVTLGFRIQGGGTGYYFNNLILENNGVSTTTGGGGGLNFNATASTSDVHLDTIISRYNYGVGVYFNGNIYNVDANNIVAIGNKSLPSRNASGTGILLGMSSTSTSAITIRNSTSTDNDANGLRVETNTVGPTPVIVTNTEASRNLNDGFSADGYGNLTCDRCISMDNGIDGLGADGDGFSWHATSTGVIKNSFASNNKKSNITHVHQSSVHMYNNILYHTTSGTIGGVNLGGSNQIFNNNLIFSDSNQSAGLIIGTSTVKNNMIYGFGSGLKGTTQTINDYNNLYNNPLGATNCASYSDCIVTGANNISGNPLFVNAAAQNYHLTDFSASIDAGTPIPGRVMDRDGNPIYGAPDIGPFEYQPPYTIGVNPINTTGGIRIYENGKYRYTSATSTSNGQFSVTPIGGYATTTGEFLNIAYGTWTDNSKEWVASSSVASTTIFTIGGLATSTLYNIKVDGNLTLATTSSATGTISYVYTGGWSTHTFSVRPYWYTESAPVASAPTPHLSVGSSGGAGAVPASLIANTNTNSVSPTTFTFTKTLSTGMSNPEVKMLQQFLNAKGFTVSLAGAGSKGKETSFFGSATRAALARFQKASGISPAVGYFGPVTRAFILMMK